MCNFLSNVGVDQIGLNFHLVFPGWCVSLVCLVLIGCGVWQATWGKILLVAGVDQLQAVLFLVLLCIVFALVHVTLVAGLLFVNGGEG